MITNPLVSAIFDALDRTAAKPRKPAPCKCGRLDFPHRRDGKCDEFEDQALEAALGFSGGNLGCADEDELAADNRARARDCNLAARGR